MKTNDVQSTIALATLQNVLDPEIGLNIVDLGLIYDINFNETDKEITCKMTLTTKLCPMGQSILDSAEKALQESFSNYKIKINLVFEPEWNFERISEEGKRFLNY